MTVPCRSVHINDFPTELLTQIFLSAADNITPSQALPTPFLIARICRSWRDIALTLPALWAHVTLYLPRTSRPNLSVLLCEWIDRARPLPLSITVRRTEPRADALGYSLGCDPFSGYFGDTGGGGYAHTHALFDLIAKERERWRDLDIFIPDRTCAARLEQVLFQCPQLENLRSAVLTGCGAPDPPSSLLLAAHNIHSLTLTNTLAVIPPSLAHLASLTATGIPLPDVLALFRASPRLEFVVLSDIGCAPNVIVGRMVLEDLTELKISDARALPCILGVLEAPSLISLHLEGSTRAPLDLGGASASPLSEEVEVSKGRSPFSGHAPMPPSMYLPSPALSFFAFAQASFPSFDVIQSPSTASSLPHLSATLPTPLQTASPTPAAAFLAAHLSQLHNLTLAGFWPPTSCPLPLLGASTTDAIKIVPTASRLIRLHLHPSGKRGRAAFANGLARLVDAGGLPALLELEVGAMEGKVGEDALHWSRDALAIGGKMSMV